MHDDLDGAEAHDEDGRRQLAVEHAAHDQPEGNGGQNDGQRKADQVALERAVARLVAVAVAVMGLGGIFMGEAFWL
ncbi:hypothetical protein D3C87_2014420 [compost metagenome]